MPLREILDFCREGFLHSRSAFLRVSVFSNSWTWLGECCCCMKILVVENHGKKGALIQDILSHGGYEFSVALDGDVALLQCLRERFDIVFTELKVRGMDGVELCRRIKEIRPGCILYAHSSELKFYDPDHLTESGVDGFIKYPARPQVVLAAVEGARQKLLRRPSCH